MNEISEKIKALVGKRIIQAEWTGNLSIDDGEGYLLTFDDGSQVLFSWYQAYDCTGVIHELRSPQQSTKADKADEIDPVAQALRNLGDAIAPPRR